MTNIIESINKRLERIENILGIYPEINIKQKTRNNVLVLNVKDPELHEIQGSKQNDKYIKIRRKKHKNKMKRIDAGKKRAARWTMEEDNLIINAIKTPDSSFITLMNNLGRSYNSVYTRCYDLGYTANDLPKPWKQELKICYDEYSKVLKARRKLYAQR